MQVDPDVNHDIITIGASTGGLEVLLQAAHDLPPDLEAAVFVVVHVQAMHESRLPEMIASRGPLPAHHPVHGEKIEPGTIYIAPPDNHLSLRPDRIDVVRGPKENGHRPAVNALFRSASTAFGPRVIGVVLSGHQDCGTAGMLSIKARGGISVVQAPESAVAPDMPNSVIENVAVDHLIHPRELGALLARLASMPAPSPATTSSAIAQLEGVSPGQSANIVCPTCDGVLTQAQAGQYEQYRCHVGHTFSLGSLVREQGEQMERALWAAVRALEESAALSGKLASRERGDMKTRFAEKARTQRDEAELIRKILLQGSTLSDEDAKLV
ncbi:MAG TPA: chemotaxis protein CheB [Kofleriaceae bacterium]